MTIPEALDALGVRPDTLTSDEKSQLDRDGYLSLFGILSPAQVESLNAVLARLANQEGENAGKEVHQKVGRFHRHQRRDARCSGKPAPRRNARERPA